MRRIAPFLFSQSPLALCLRALPLLALPLLALSLSLLAAGTATAQQQPRPGAPPIVLPMGQDRMMTLSNRSTQPVTTLYVSPSTDDNWGANRLSIPNVAPGRTFQLRLAGRDCKFDIQVVYADGKIEEKREQDLCRNRMASFDGSQARMPGQERTITLMNRAPRPIKQLFISAQGANNWGDDLLPRGEVETGDDIDIRFRGPCVNDIRVVFDNNSAEERREVDLCDRDTAFIAPGWTTTERMPTSADDLPAAAAAPSAAPLEVSNQTGTEIVELYIFPHGASQQGPDLLGSDTMESGKYQSVRLARGGDLCRFDVKVVFDGPRDDLRLEDIDLCATDELRLTTREGDTPPATAPAGRAAPARPPAAEGPIPAGMSRLRNTARMEAVAVFADPVGTERTLDRLGDRTLEAGEAFDLAPPVAGTCDYTLVVLYRDGSTATAQADLCAGREVPLP